MQGVIFKDPLHCGEDVLHARYFTADAYLSGNVREKLSLAKTVAQSHPEFTINVAALEAAMPKELDASEIDVRLGATWIDVKYIQRFMREVLHCSRVGPEAHFTDFTAEWSISNKNSMGLNDVTSTSTFGTSRANAYKLLEDALNLRDARVFDVKTDTDGTEHRELNQKETTLAQQKQQAIKTAFTDWIFKNPERRKDLVETYNVWFNSVRPREYDGQHINFVGMNPEIKLREHQINAIAHILYGGNTLLAHEVGAGKTYEMIAAAMESKRLGLCQKPLFVVPNHLTEQWANEFLTLYPAANILVTTKKDFEKENRKRFCARIATGDYDAIIMGHSQFERLPMSQERQQALLDAQIEEVTEGIRETRRQRGDNVTIKQLERTKKGLEAKLKKLTDSPHDDVVTFEQLGVDRLIVDEAHAFKNLFLYTKMRNVAGLSTSEAQKSSDMFLKCRYMDEKTGNKGVVFATGTPVSNTMAEVYTMMRYLQYDTLQKQKMTHFDAWASNFGETQTSIELAPEGTGYRARTRFSKFFNLPELMTMFKEVADIKTADQLHLPAPECTIETVVAKPSEIQTALVQELGERAEKVHANRVDPTEDNMLKITTDGRKLGLDPRIIDPDFADEPTSKVNLCVENVHRIWQENADKKSTQLIFSDTSTPHKDSFNVYDDIRSKLIARGVPEKEVAFIHDANTEAKKSTLFAKVRKGDVRILLGSTAKMGAGTNVQDLLIASHDLDCPWRPADLTQRAGRIVRQGNTNPEVKIYRYVTEGTFDAYLWQTVEQKQKFISQIMTSKSPVRSCEDMDAVAMDYATTKALCAGDPKIAEKMNLDNDVTKLKLLKASHKSNQYRLEDNLLQVFPAQIEGCKSALEGLAKDIAKRDANTPADPEADVPIIVADATYLKKDVAGAALLAECKVVGENRKVGSYKGFSLHSVYSCFSHQGKVTVQGAVHHEFDIGTDARGMITRLENCVNDMEKRRDAVQEHLTHLQEQTVLAQAECGKPFPQEAELQAKLERLAILDTELNLDARSEPEQAQSQTQEATVQTPEVTKPTVEKSQCASLRGRMHVIDVQLQTEQTASKSKNHQAER